MDLQSEKKELIDISIATFTEGWLTYSEGQELAQQASKAKKIIVEIGSWKGKSTSCLLLGNQKNPNPCTVYAVDTFEGSAEHKLKNQKTSIEEFQSNINKLPLAAQKQLITFKMTSKQLSKISDINNIGLLFIDGSHDLISVLEDFVLYLDKVADDGVIIFHDADSWRAPTAVS